MSSIRSGLLISAVVAAAGITLAACGGTSSPSTDAATSPGTAEVGATVPGGGDAPDEGLRCALPGDTEAIVVTGVLDCASIEAVWTRATADPDFTDQGAPVVSGDFRCRAHGSEPERTGFCESDGAPHSAFEVVGPGHRGEGPRGPGHHRSDHPGPGHHGAHHGGHHRGGRGN